jgi:hypothetical protein
MKNNFTSFVNEAARPEYPWTGVRIVRENGANASGGIAPRRPRPKAGFGLQPDPFYNLDTAEPDDEDEAEDRQRFRGDEDEAEDGETSMLCPHCGQHFTIAVMRKRRSTGEMTD